MSNIFENCSWICAEKSVSSPIIYKEFDLSEKIIEKAVLSITGLGYFEAEINGKPVTNFKLLPVASDYEPKPLSRSALYYPIDGTTGTSRIYYYQFDVSELLSSSKNLLTIQLGNGWYTVKDFGDTKKTVFKLDVETDVGTFQIFSDGTETWTESEIRYNNIFTGEIHDANFITTERLPVKTTSTPQSLLSPAIGTPDKIIGRVNFKFLGEINGRKIFDLGQSVSGIVRIKTSSKKGDKITVRFTELLTDDGELFFNFGVGAEWQIDGAPQIMKDEFICDGSTREFTPKFVWHAFRYFDIEGDFDELDVLELRSDVAITSSFNSDSEGLNFLYNSFISTQLGNMHGSFPSDCPHRERIGYTGDGQICATATMMMTDSREFYKKWIQDILDCQMSDGYVHHTAPYYGGAGGPGIWGSAIVYVPYRYYLQYGDKDILFQSYDGMVKWIDYLSTCLEDGLLTHEVKSSLSLGDWANLGGVRLPSKYVNSCCFIKILSLVSEIATLLARDVDIPRFNALKKTIESAIKKNYMSDDGVSFADSVQGADAFAVWCGIAGEKTIRHIAEIYDSTDYFDTGFMGTDILLEILFDNGYQDIAYKLLQSREKGSFLYMKDNGATTLWENWNGGRMSRFHPMLGGCSRHIFSSILGIRQAKDSVGYKKIVISPRAPKEMTFANGKMTTPYGEISVSWSRTGNNIKIDYSVPDGIEVIK